MGNPIKLNIIKIVHQDVLEKYSDLSKVDFKNTELLQTYFSYYNYKNLFSPVNKCNFFTYSFDSDFIEILERFAFINGIEDFDAYDGEHAPETQKDLLEDEVRFKLDLDNEKEENDEINKEYQKIKVKLFESKIDEISKNEDIISDLLKDEILKKYYYKEEVYQHHLKNDSVIFEAVKLLNNQEQYYKILSVK